MSKYYSVIDLSENISETPEGYLVCKGTAIARSGDLPYRSYESGISSNDGVSIISRSIDDLCNEETTSSFEGKPITIGHPEDGKNLVGPDNWQDFAVGTIQSVRQGEGLDSDKLLADLLITDREAIQAVKDGKLRQLSCGYEANFIETEEGRGKQTDIVGNHVALVEKGRCGSQCAIFDSAPEIKPEKSMTISEKLKKAIGMAVDSAIDADMPDDEKKVSDKDAEVMSKMSQRMDTMQTQLDEYMSQKKSSDEDEEGKTNDEDSDSKNSQMDMVLSLLEKLSSHFLSVEDEDPDKDKASDEDKKDDGDDKKSTSDSETLSRAEILCPGVEDGGGIKDRALKGAYETEDGKKAIDSILSGKAFDSVDQDMLFVSASEVLKAMRVQKTNSVKKMAAGDSATSKYPSAEELNQKFEAFHAKK